MINILETTSKVRFQDCDPFNYLNNATYLKAAFLTEEIVIQSQLLQQKREMHSEEFMKLFKKVVNTVPE